MGFFYLRLFQYLTINKRYFNYPNLNNKANCRLSDLSIIFIKDINPNQLEILIGYNIYFKKSIQIRK